jgi:hypothetical protein
MTKDETLLVFTLVVSSVAGTAGECEEGGVVVVGGSAGTSGIA